MSLDTPEVADVVSAPLPPRTGWRPAWVIASLVVVLAVLAMVLGYLGASSPSIVPGSVILPGRGVVQLTDGLETTRWLQTDKRAFVAFAVRNPGDRTVTLSWAPDPAQGPNIMPRQTVGFLPQLQPNGGEPPSLETADPALLSSIDVAPGDEVYVVMKVWFPCLAARADAATSGRHTIDMVRLQGESLGRTSTLNLPLPWPLAVPRDARHQCTLDMFTS